MRIAFATLAIFSIVLFSTAWPTVAAEIESAYTKLDFKNGCQWEKAASEEEAQMGGSAMCDGYKNFPVYFAEGDIRQFTAFGPVDDPMTFPGGFSEWNSVNETIEWRLDRGQPFATIHRWFIDNIDPDTGSADAKLQGQVLVVTTVTNPDAPLGKRVSCAVGYIDALENRDANIIARQVADDVGRYFLCGQDRPKYYGNRGPLSGTPNDLGG